MSELDATLVSNNHLAHNWYHLIKTWSFSWICIPTNIDQFCHVRRKTRRHAWTQSFKGNLSEKEYTLKYV